MIATLTYHSIDDSGSPVSVSPLTFAGHLRWLTAGGVTVKTLDALATGSGPGAPAVAVTFDDGFATIRQPVEELLDHGIVPTIFVVTQHVGGTNAWGGREARAIPTRPLLTWTDLEGLAGRGAAIEAHTRTHPHLTSVSATQRDDEIGGCREDLKARLGVESRHLAYPYGDVDEAVAAAAGRQYAYGHTAEMRAILPDERPLYLPRLDAYYFRTPGGFDGFGGPAFNHRLRFIRLRRRVRSMVRPW